MSLSFSQKVRTETLPIIAHVSPISGTSPLQEDRWPEGGSVERWGVVKEWLGLLVEERKGEEESREESSEEGTSDKDGNWPWSSGGSWRAGVGREEG